MILKDIDGRDAEIRELERIKGIASADILPKIEQEIRNIQSGLHGEREAAYLIDFHLKNSVNYGVIHDLRLSINGRIAQIDHLLIHRSLDVYVLETKNLHASLKITDNGEFLRWNQYKKTYEGMASPIAQNERHIAVLKDAFGHMEMPKRLGMRLSPVFHSYVLVSPKVRIDRPKNLDTSCIVKSDMFKETLDESFDKAGVLTVIGKVSRLVSTETVREIGKQLIALHEPATFHYAERFGITEPNTKSGEPKCRHCGSNELLIKYGHSYYFKCTACTGNTPIEISCGHPGHKEKVRKEGRNFYRECANCHTSSLYYVNPV